MVCDKCGFRNEEGAKVCASCGSQLSDKPSDPRDAKPTSESDVEHGHDDTMSKDNGGTNFAASGILGLNEFEQTQYQPTFTFDIPITPKGRSLSDGSGSEGHRQPDAQSLMDNGSGRETRSASATSHLARVNSQPTPDALYGQGQSGYAAQMNSANLANAAFGVNSGNLADLVNASEDRVSSDPSDGVSAANGSNGSIGTIGTIGATGTTGSGNSDNPQDPHGAGQTPYSSPDNARQPLASAQQQPQATPQQQPQQSPTQQPNPQNQPQTPAHKQRQPSRRKRLLIGIGIAIAAILAICLIVVEILGSGILGTYSPNSTSPASSATSPTKVKPSTSAPQQTTTSEQPSKTVFDKKQLDTLISQFSASDAAIAGIDINGKDTYSSQLATTKFVAAGLYLPIYLDAHSGKNPNSITASDVMMNTMSNNDANTAMTDLGGFSAVTDWLHTNGYASTEIGRNFGDVAASNGGLENYSTAADSVAMLKATEAAGGANLMTYNIAADGIAIPAGMQISAHRGQGIKNAYNYFLIIKVKDYAIALAVLTKNHSGQEVTDLTSKVLQSIDSMIAQ
ncbi:serine hydrolase [Bifidobacterium aquikefiricola]|uniref:Serine hydrolase n=1 Tax=Bifidobacterium aquikefiricola TaxID=3059038 RepID=A0AB39U850_9BIFI